MPSPLDLLPGNPFAGEPPLPRGFAPKAEQEAVPKPGCTAGDETFLVYEYLKRLGEGWGGGNGRGFGLLRIGKQRLEAAAKGAYQMGARDVSEEIKALASRLPDIRDEPTAASTALEMEPLLRKTWALGQRCGGRMRQLTPDEIRQALKAASDG